MPRKKPPIDIQTLREIREEGYLNGGLFRALSFLRPACQALIAPQAVVLDTGSKVRPLVRRNHDAPGTLEAGFESAVTGLLQMIDDSGSRGRRLHLVVSDFWARPLVLPLEGKMPSDEDVDTVLQSHYRRTYGDLMDGWLWCWAVQGARLLAVAWPVVGLTALRDGLRQRAGILASARPLATDVVSKALPEGVSSWLAIMERQSVTLVRLQDGVWQDWCVIPGDPDMVESLPLQLARETARRRDDCRALTIVDLNGTTNTKLLRKALGEAGWSIRVCSSNEINKSLACRLSQVITQGTPA